MRYVRCANDDGNLPAPAPDPTVRRRDNVLAIIAGPAAASGSSHSCGSIAALTSAVSLLGLPFLRPAPERLPQELARLPPCLLIFADF
jgi:hypothetical protein